MLFTSFIGHTTFPAESLEFFRAYAVDATMLVFPTKGLFWLWDAVGLRLNRNDAYYFGDASVWMTTFSLLPMVFGPVGILILKRHRYVASLVLIAMVGTYLSLGPSLKVHSLRPKEDIAAGRFSSLMPAKDAVMHGQRISLAARTRLQGHARELSMDGARLVRFLGAVRLADR